MHRYFVIKKKNIMINSKNKRENNPRSGESERNSIINGRLLLKRENESSIRHHNTLNSGLIG